MATSVRFDADAIIHRVPEPLFAAEIPLSRLDAHVAEQELDLFQLAASLVTETRACAAEIVCIAHFEHASFTTPQMTFGLNPFAAIRPALFIARKIVPERRFAAAIHDCKPEATHAGIGIVRT